VNVLYIDFESSVIFVADHLMISFENETMNELVSLRKLIFIMLA